MSPIRSLLNATPIFLSLAFVTSSKGADLRNGGHLGLKEDHAESMEPAPSRSMALTAAKVTVPDPHWCDNGHLVGTGSGFCVLPSR